MIYTAYALFSFSILCLSLFQPVGSWLERGRQYVDTRAADAQKATRLKCNNARILLRAGAQVVLPGPRAMCSISNVNFRPQHQT